MEAGECLLGAAELAERLGGHLVGGNVVGIVANKGGELGKGGISVVLAYEFHGEAVAGKGVGRVELEDFVESGKLVHLSMVGSWRKDCKCGQTVTTDEGDDSNF
jgi:hypothetical protein